MKRNVSIESQNDQAEVCCGFDSHLRHSGVGGYAMIINRRSGQELGRRERHRLPTPAQGVRLLPGLLIAGHSVDNAPLRRT